MKNAKKSMFITTILMVAVLIVAVSTATFAWYTASGTGSATGAALKAAESSDANIAVDWANNGHGTSIIFDSAETSLQPMVPQADYLSADYISANGEASFDDFKFHSASVDLISNTFNSVSAPSAWTVKQNDGDGTVFYVINHNVDSDVNVKMKASFTGDIKNMVNVAVFIDGTLVAIFNEAGATYKVGPVVEDQAPSTVLASATAATSGADGYIFTVAKNGGYKAITIKAWLDGELLTSPNAGKTAGFSFNFEQAV